jgi:hypothetical protein
LAATLEDPVLIPVPIWEVNHFFLVVGRTSKTAVFQANKYSFVTKIPLAGNKPTKQKVNFKLLNANLCVGKNSHWLVKIKIILVLIMTIVEGFRSTFY